MCAVWAVWAVCVVGAAWVVWVVRCGEGEGGGAGMHWRPLNTLTTQELQAMVLWAVRVVLQAMVLWAVRVVERCENQGSGGAEG